MTPTRLLIGILLIALLCCYCTGQTQSGSGLLSESVASTWVRIGVIGDATESKARFGVPRIRPEDLAPLLDLLRSRGGEIAVGLVTDQSRRPLLRLFVPASPPAVIDNSRTATNRFQIALLRSQYQRDSLKQAQQYQVLTRDVDRRISEFESRLEASLAPQRETNHSDVAGAVNRLATFLSEAPPEPKILVKNFALIVSDGEHNIGSAELLPLPAGTITVIVPNSQTGLLGQLSSQTFENVAAAVRFIINKSSEGPPQEALAGGRP